MNGRKNAGSGRRLLPQHSSARSSSRPHHEKLNQAVAKSPLLPLLVRPDSSTMLNMTLCQSGAPRRLLSRTGFCWTGLPMRGDPQNFSFCVVSMSSHPYLLFCRLPWNKLVTVHKSSLRCKTSKSYYASLIFKLHLALGSLSLSWCRAAPCRRRQ